MFVDSSITRLNGKAYPRHLLRESYREAGKVKHRTIANLSHCKAEEVEAIRLALRHKADLARIVSAAGEGGLEFIDRLPALILPPRIRRHRYFGVVVRTAAHENFRGDRERLAVHRGIGRSALPRI